MPMRSFLLGILLRKARSLPHAKYDLCFFPLGTFPVFLFAVLLLPLSCNFSEPPRFKAALSGDLEGKGHLTSSHFPVLFIMSAQSYMRPLQTQLQALPRPWGLPSLFIRAPVSSDQEGCIFLSSPYVLSNNYVCWILSNIVM